MNSDENVVYILEMLGKFLSLWVFMGAVLKFLESVDDTHQLRQRVCKND